LSCPWAATQKPSGFYGLAPGHTDDLMVPVTTIGPAMLTDPGSPWFESVARLKPGVPSLQARAEIDAIFQAFMGEYPQSAEARRDQFRRMELASASRGLDELRKRFSRPLTALMALVALVLLVACANITNLLLARAAKRTREFAIRIAIGAGRGRLLRQLFVETATLFLLGAAAGGLLALWATRIFTIFFAAGPRPILLEVHWDWRVISFTVGMSLLASLIFGAAPILRAIRTDPHMAMKDGARATDSRSRLEMGRLLVAFQVGLAMILLVSALLFLRTLHNLRSVDPGFRVDKVALLTIHLTESSYTSEAQRIAAWGETLAVTRSLPGVRSASLSMMTPLDGSGRRVGFKAPGFQPLSDGDTFISLNTVSEDYFSTLGTPLLSGRAFTEGDNLGAPNVAMLNESGARHFFAGRDPIGTVVNINERQYRIIGVVRDAKHEDIRGDAGRYIYIPMRQPYDRNFLMTLSIRSTSDPEPLIPTIQTRVRSVSPDILITGARTLADQLDESLLQEHLISTLAATFGVLALALSAVGLYGVLAYSVARRATEIGIRVALGARPAQVTWSIVRQTMLLVALGLAAGAPTSIFIATAAANLLYGVTPTDFSTLAIAATLLVVVAFVASYLPARRAGRIDPMAALRQ
jgi:predicted permease